MKTEVEDIEVTYSCRKCGKAISAAMADDSDSLCWDCQGDEEVEPC